MNSTSANQDNQKDLDQIQSQQSDRPVDTIPPEVKQHFFRDVTMPNLLTDYDVLGFDADHCLVKYNIQPIVEMLIDLELDDFIEMGYPKSIKKFYQLENAIQMCLNGSIFDIDNGLVIKLTEGQEVVRALKGYKQLSQAEIQEVYGSPPVFTHYQWPNTTHLSGKQGAYWTFLTFFDTPKVALVLSAIDLIEKGLVKNKSYHDVADDIKTIVYKNYIHFNDKEVKKIGTYGKFFPEMVKDPSKYIQFQPSLRQSLQTLRDAGKKLFLATNSHTEYSNLIMTATLGEDWRSFFDIICCYCRKPLFFWDVKTDPFYELNLNVANQKGRAIMDPEFIVQGATYTQGNSKTLTGFFERILERNGLRIAFFGDQYITDVYSSSVNEGWDAFAVVEELNHYDPRYSEGEDPQLIKYDSFWGEDTYFVEKSVDGKRVKRSYFISQVEDCARYMLPLMRNINLMMGQSENKNQ